MAKCFDTSVWGDQLGCIFGSHHQRPRPHRLGWSGANKKRVNLLSEVNDFYFISPYTHFLACSSGMGQMLTSVVSLACSGGSTLSLEGVKESTLPAQHEVYGVHT